MQRAGFVLTGGSSTRMGLDKARLALGSRLMVEEIAETVREAAGQVLLVGAAERYRDLPFDRLEDTYPASGPLSGIETALASGRARWNLIVACDMPDLWRLPLRQLCAEAETSATRCLVCRDARGRVHPLCGAWSSDCLPEVRSALKEKRLRVTDLLDEVKVQYFDIDQTIANVNTPDEWQAWRNSVVSGQ